MPTLTGPPMQPPLPPLLIKSAQMTPAEVERNIVVLYDYLNTLVDYLYNYNPTVESP